MNNIILAGVKIRQDKNGLYCLNDLWRARGSIKREKINSWSRLNETKNLIDAENLNAQICAFKQSSGRHGGTYANKTLVYDYAMWISPEFKSHVISVFDGHVTRNIEKSLECAVDSIKLSMVNISEAVNCASIHFDDIKDCGKSWGKAGSDIRKAKKKAVEELENLKNEIQFKLEF